MLSDVCGQFSYAIEEPDPHSPKPDEALPDWKAESSGTQAGLGRGTTPRGRSRHFRSGSPPQSVTQRRCAT
jgi:hypothetical protein